MAIAMLFFKQICSEIPYAILKRKYVHKVIRGNMGNKILLTGAGFTHNFGAPLVGGLWAQIFNNPILQQQERVQKLLADSFNYERVYQYVQSSDDFNRSEKEALREAVTQAFEFVDYVVRMPSPGYRDMHHGAVKIIEQFTKDRGGSGFFFTLNQDLYVERKCRIPRIKFTAPGLSQDKIISNDMNKLSESDYVTLPTAEELLVNCGQVDEIAPHEILYFKLHGSHHWQCSTNEKKPVLADDLRATEEPLLQWYKEVFERCLAAKDTRLLVIGYSFRDDYINRCLAEHITENNLQLHVLSPVPPQTFKGKLAMRVMGSEIYEGLAGYYECGLQEMFPHDVTVQLSQHWQNLENNFFKAE